MIIIYKQCPICGKLFKANTHGRPRKYCSKECKIKQKNIKRKERRIIIRKCQYCGKEFEGNKKQIYCSSECYEKAHQDKMNKRNSHRWYHDIEYRKQNVLIYGSGVGTIKLAENKDNDWEKELIRVRALKKQAGLNRRA